MKRFLIAAFSLGLLIAAATCVGIRPVNSGQGDLLQLAQTR